MSNNYNVNRLCAFILVLILLLSTFPVLIVNASENNEIKNISDRYNCYAYAIGRFEETKYYWPFDEQFPRYQPGEIYKIHPYVYYDYDNDVYTLATIVQNDLISLGYTNILIYQSQNDDYNINDDEINTYSDLLESIDFEFQELICTRIEGPTEYHFMKYDVETNSWYSKYGYGPIEKYTDNAGIPSNNVDWTTPDFIYDSNIVYIIYDKLQIKVDNGDYASENIIIQGCETGYSAKDAFYEVVVPESGCYTIEIDTSTIEAIGSEGVVNFNYEIYSYNMYNGNYSIMALGGGVSGETYTQAVNLTAYDDYNDGSENWQYQTYKYYIRLDFGRENTSDETVTVNISRGHSYTDHYESISRNKHKSYCSCGEYITESHQVEGDAYVLCGAAHLHTYMYSWVSNTGHRVNCTCGYSEVKSHVVPADAFGSGEMFATCLLCNGRVTLSESIMSTVNLPHSENGSFILPNGVIVLTDEDIESYMNGTLEFIYPEDDSVTS